jgi:UDP-N-acetylmuramoylalanine--D-glutamate ligase
MKKIGIVGFGVVGKSVLNFLNSFGLKKDSQDSFEFKVWDERELTGSEVSVINDMRSEFVDGKNTPLKSFLEKQDYIISSPGVDLRQYDLKNKKFINELDLFAQFFKKPSISITGSLGKTTITNLIYSFIQNAAVAGNIGKGMLDLIETQDKIDCAVLELSSFQLEYSNYFKPKVAILTNVYPNHLNRHSSLREYINAKWNIFAYQDETQHSLFPLSLVNSYSSIFIPKFKALKSQSSFVSFEVPQKLNLTLPFLDNKTVFYIENNQFCKSRISLGTLVDTQVLFKMDVLPDVTFEENWLFVLSTLHLYGICLWDHNFKVGDNEENFFCEHRLEFVKSIDGADFYNDSKATVIQATRAAVQKLEQNGRPQILILGGLNKDVDRLPLVQFLKKTKNIKKIVCFGDCKDLEKYFPIFTSLEDAMHDIMRIIKPNDQVLFSPSGSSFDLFDNYKHRGEVFKQLIFNFYENSKGEECQQSGGTP